MFVAAEPFLADFADWLFEVQSSQKAMRTRLASRAW